MDNAQVAKLDMDLFQMVVWNALKGQSARVEQTNVRNVIQDHGHQREVQNVSPVQKIVILVLRKENAFLAEQIMGWLMECANLVQMARSVQQVKHIVSFLKKNGNY